jgi:periplasmic divalent cation tolerance protein
MNSVVVLTTCGSAREARRIAEALVAGHLAACVNIASAPVHSVYRWKGAIDHTDEFLLLIKTVKRRLRALQKEIERLHSYDVPEFLVLPVAGGSEAYLQWLAASVQSPPRRKRS